MQLIMVERQVRCSTRLCSLWINSGLLQSAHKAGIYTKEPEYTPHIIQRHPLAWNIAKLGICMYPGDLLIGNYRQWTAALPR